MDDLNDSDMELYSAFDLWDTTEASFDLGLELEDLDTILSSQGKFTTLVIWKTHSDIACPV